MNFKRISFYKRYLSSLNKAINDGADVRGFYAWSFTDNFEWHRGYDMRFGMVYIDYENQKRIPKDSFFFYKNLIESLIVITSKASISFLIIIGTIPTYSNKWCTSSTIF